MLLIIDNYDSFTYNLVHYFGELGAESQVARNDSLSVEQVLAKKIAGIVLSPGPGTPDEAGICLEMVSACLERDIPLLGVCLGHQSIGQACGGTVHRAQRLMHGKTDWLNHEGKGLFQNLPSPMQATRYHSLIVEPTTLPDQLEITATSGDGNIMAVQHKDKPVFGLQFHPESIRTTHGKDLLKNFLQICQVDVNPLDTPSNIAASGGPSFQIEAA